MKKLRLLTLGLMSFGIVLTSCSNAGSLQETSPRRDDVANQDDKLAIDVLSAWTPRVVINHNEDLTHSFDEMTPLDPIDQQRLSSTMFDVPRNSTLNMHFTKSAPEYFSCVNVVKNFSYYLSVKDVVSSTFQSNPPLSTDGNVVSLTFDSSFQYGRVYKISLSQDACLQFENKDPSIQTLTIEIEDDPSEASEYNVCVPKDNIPTLDLSKVSEEKTEENELMSFVYNGSVPEFSEGDIFLVKDGSNGDELGMADFYGLFKSKEQVDDKWKVYYSEPSGEDIYEDLRLKGVKPADLSGLEVAATKEYIQEQFRYSDSARGLLAFFAKQAGTRNVEQLGSIMDYLQLGLDFKYYDNTLLFTFTIGATNIKLRDNLYLSIAYTYEITKDYTVDYDVSLKKEWGIPVGVAYKVKCVEQATESHTILVSVVYTKDQDPQDEEDVQNSLFDELKNAKLNKDNFFKKIKESADAVAQTEGNKTTIPIFKFPFTLPGGMIFEIRLDLSFDFTIQAMAFVRKQVKSQNVVFNFSSEGGGDSSDAKTIEGANNWDVYFMGLVEFKLALKLALAWYIAGTYKFFHVEAYGEVWIKVGLQGSLMASFATDTDGSAFSGNLSLDFYVQFGVDVGLELVAAFFHTGIDATLFKAYIFRIYMCNEVEHYSDGTVTRIEMINSTKDNINNYDILNFRVWDGVYMIMDARTFKADDRQSIITLFGQEILGVYMFTFTPEDESLLKVSQDGTISIPDGTPAEFTTHFTIHLSDAISFVNDREIEVYFNAPDAHHVNMHEYVDGVETGVVTDVGRYRPTATFTFPEPPDKGGHKFLSYEVDGVDYAPGSTISMPADDLNVKIKWHKIIYYQVYFYDGKGNAIYVDNHVEEFTAAIEPSAEIRDQYMQGYKFLGWDKNFSKVTSNMVIRGIYAKVGD